MIEHFKALFRSVILVERLERGWTCERELGFNQSSQSGNWVLRIGDRLVDWWESIHGQNGCSDKTLIEADNVFQEIKSSTKEQSIRILLRNCKSWRKVLMEFIAINIARWKFVLKVKASIISTYPEETSMLPYLCMLVFLIQHHQRMLNA